MTSTTLPDPDGGGGLSAPVTTYGYDILGRRTSLTDPTGNVTSWAYDGLSRVTSETNELSEVRTFEYNAASQLTKRTDRRGLAREFSYDPLGRMTSEVWKNGGSTVRTISFAYNAGSALTSASDADSSYAYTYDNLGRVTNVDNNGTSGVPRVQLASAYDANGNRTSVSATITSTLDLLNSYSYDGLNRLTRLDQTGQTGGNTVAEKRVDFAYNARGQFASLARFKDTDGGSGNEVATSTFAYDNLGRLTALDHKHSTTDLANYDWTYDAASRVTQFAYAHLVGGSGTSDYSYDNTNQVTAANHSDLTDESYAFDASGNRTNSGYSTGDDNQLSSDGTFNYTYDDEGNRLTRTRISSAPATDKTVEYTWDHRNRLTQVKNKDQTSATTQVVEYIYDVYDRKIGRQVDSDGDADWDSVERYLYDGDDVVLEFLDADGDGAGSQALSKRYLWGPAVDQLLAQEDVAKTLSADDRVLWPLTDNLGSVRDLADQTGDVVNHIEYDSFGKPARVLDAAANSIALSAVPTRYLYTTREYDSLTDLQYNRARWYDPHVGKWLSLDPIGFAAGDTNLSRYVGNNATNSIDPSGLRGEGHHIVPWSIFDEKVSAEVHEFFDSLAARIWNQYYNCHNGKTLNGISHDAYNDAVRDQLIAWLKKRGILRNGMTLDQALGRLSLKDAKAFLAHLKQLPYNHAIRMFNRGVASEALSALRAAKAAARAARAVRTAGRTARDFTCRGIPVVPDATDGVMAIIDALTTPYDESSDTLFGPRIDAVIEGFFWFCVPEERPFVMELEDRIQEREGGHDEW